MLDKPYDPKNTEDKIYKLWEESGFFAPEAHQPRADNPNSDKTFTICVPPPNVTGSLHMGHALNATIQDILIRKKRMEGFRTLWLPGIDHAGIATQNVVEKDLKKQGISRHDLGREKFIEKIWEWKEKYGNIILEQFKRLGASMDWSRLRFTMDDDYREAVTEAFIRYYEKGYLYRAERVINWCSRCRTSLSDLELEYKEEQANLYYIKYGPILIATVRPETKLGDTAIAVYPEHPKYKKYIGEELDVQTVLGPRRMKVIADPDIDPNFGTGAMKVTPAHDLHDFELGEKNGLEKLQVIGMDGRMTEKAGKYAGMKIVEAREKVIADMKEIGILEKVEPYTHNVAVCYRCNTIVEPLLSLQWFLSMKELAKMATREAESGNIKFYPDSWKKVYLDWLKNVRDWNVSRQIWWGHQIPVFYCSKKQESNLKSQISNLNGKANEEFIVAKEKPEKCPFCKECEMIQDPDVLDTWFSSALWPFATLHWPSQCQPTTNDQRPMTCEPKENSDLQKFYPTQVLSTARDIINLWVSRMIFSGMEFMGEKPFSDVIIHATVLAKSGQRMSKSLGTGVDPMGLIEQYGADATRFALIWQAMGTQDMKWDETALMAGKKFCNKLWNIARFVLQKQNGISNFQFPISNEFSMTKFSNENDKKILNKLEEVKKSVGEKIDGYEFGPALHELYDFIWHNFADVYIEESKKRKDDEAKQVLFKILTDSLKMLHPFMPSITEEIYQNLQLTTNNKQQEKKLLMVEKWE